MTEEFFTLFNALFPSLAPRLAIMGAVRNPNVLILALNEERIYERV
jgi:hypothetical protein